MNIEEAKIGLKHITNLIFMEKTNWQNILKESKTTLRKFAEQQFKIFQAELKLCDVKKKDMFAKVHNLQMQFTNLEKTLNLLKLHLCDLKHINMQTQCMLSQVCMWKDDDIIKSYRITKNMTTYMLWEFLSYIAPRYDAEYELKEMVVYELQNMTIPGDLDILQHAWFNNPHTIDDEKFIWTYQILAIHLGVSMPRNSLLPMNYYLRSDL